MPLADYRIESAHSIAGPLLPACASSVYLVSDRGTAVVMAAKSVTIPWGEEIRVVHVPTGEVIFRKSAAPAAPLGDDW